MSSLYNELLDGDTVHTDDKTVTGKPFPIPTGVSDSQRPFGGHESTALESINFITINREGAANRNVNYIRENIAREKAYQEAHAENA